MEKLIAEKQRRSQCKSGGGLRSAFKEGLEIHQPSFPPPVSTLEVFRSKDLCAVGSRDWLALPILSSLRDFRPAPPALPKARAASLPEIIAEPPHRLSRPPPPTTDDH